MLIDILILLLVDSDSINPDVVVGAKFYQFGQGCFTIKTNPKILTTAGYRSICILAVPVPAIRESLIRRSRGYLLLFGRDIGFTPSISKLKVLRKASSMAFECSSSRTQLCQQGRRPDRSCLELSHDSYSRSQTKPLSFPYLVLSPTRDDMSLILRLPYELPDMLSWSRAYRAIYTGADEIWAVATCSRVIDRMECHWSLSHSTKQPCHVTGGFIFNAKHTRRYTLFGKSREVGHPSCISASNSIYPAALADKLAW